MKRYKSLFELSALGFQKEVKRLYDTNKRRFNNNTELYNFIANTLGISVNEILQILQYSEKKKYNPLFSLLEGKKQAIQRLSARIKDDNEQTKKYQIKKYIDALVYFDPTQPKNKYVDLFTMFFIEEFSNNNYSDYKDMDRAMSDLKYKFFNDDIQKKINIIEKRNEKINLGKIKTYKQFIDILNSIIKKRTKSFTKGGIKGLKKDIDYIELDFSKLVTGIGFYVPLNFEASAKIASQSTGNCKGFWCTANAEEGDRYWVDYGSKGVIFVYVIDYINSTKFAIAFYSNGTPEIYDEHDKLIGVSDFEEAIDVEVDLIWKQVQKYKSKIEDKLENQYDMDKKVREWLEDQSLNSGENIEVTSHNIVIIKTNGFNKNSLLYEILDTQVIDILYDPIDNFYYDYWKKYSPSEIVDFLQDNVKDFKAKNEIEEIYPDLFKQDIRDEEFNEWAEKYDFAPLEQVINRADEDSWYNNAFLFVKKHAMDELKEVFNDVEQKSLDEIYLYTSVEDLIDMAGSNLDFMEDYYSTGETLSTLIDQTSEIGRPLNNRDLSYNVYPEPEKIIDDIILNYGIEE